MTQRTLVEDLDRQELDAVARLGAHSQRATPVSIDVMTEWQVLRPDGRALDLDGLERWVLAIDQDADGLGWLQHSRYWSAYRVERPGQPARLFIGDVGGGLLDGLQEPTWTAPREPALIGASAGRWCFHLTDPPLPRGTKGVTAVGARSASAKARAGLTTNEVFSLAATLLRQGRLRLMPTRHWVRSLGRGRGRRWRAKSHHRSSGIAGHGAAPDHRSRRCSSIRPATHLLTIREGFTLACYLGLPAASSLYRVRVGVSARVHQRRRASRSGARGCVGRRTPILAGALAQGLEESAQGGDRPCSALSRTRQYRREMRGAWGGSCWRRVSFCNSQPGVDLQGAAALAHSRYGFRDPWNARSSARL